MSDTSSTDTGGGDVTLAGILDPLTGFLSKGTETYLEVTGQQAANKNSALTTQANLAQAQADKLNATAAAAQAASQWIPGVSNTVVIAAGAVLVGLAALALLAKR